MIRFLRFQADLKNALFEVYRMGKIRLILEAGNVFLTHKCPFWGSGQKYVPTTCNQSDTIMLTIVVFCFSGPSTYILSLWDSPHDQSHPAGKL